MNQNTNLNQQELLSDLLTQEKQLVKDYAGNITETSCKNLRQLLLSNMAECSCDQYTVFDEMRKRQMYETKQAQPTEVSQTKQKMQQLKQETGF